MSKDDVRDSVASHCSAALDWMAETCGIQCVLIGGAVRDLLRGGIPKDWDFYCLGSDPRELRRRLVRHSEDMRKPFKRHPALVAEMKTPFGQAQVFSSQCVSAREIVSRSDWNVSAFGFDGEFIGEDRLNQIAPGETLRLLEVSNPINTLSRGFEFAKRFEMAFRVQDVVALCEAVASGKFRRPNRAIRRIKRRGF